jgi:hypothetical protein
MGEPGVGAGAAVDPWLENSFVGGQAKGRQHQPRGNGTGLGLGLSLGSAREAGGRRQGDAQPVGRLVRAIGYDGGNLPPWRGSRLVGTLAVG